MLQSWMIPADLAPGDTKSTRADWQGFELHRIRSTSDPLFPLAFDALWKEFGTKAEMEQPDVIESRMRWDPARLVNGCALLYELLLITHKREFVGVRDHTAIVRPECGTAVVHMSHNLVAPQWRRSGIAGWLRALPAQTARTCLAAQARPVHLPICLVGEMEPADPGDKARMIRLAAYEKAGYRKIDPSSISYLQPDFRTPSEIDADGGPRPLSLLLLVRFVGDEFREFVDADTVRAIVASLYRMYAIGFREKDMIPLWQNLERFPGGATRIPLLPPTMHP